MTKSTKLKPSPEQQAIIDYKGDTIVISNPGTGKTTTLAMKVIDLLENGVKPENILCITFAAKAKKVMLDAIWCGSKGKFSDADVLKINIHTFHGFAIDYLREAGLIPGDIVGNNFLRYSVLQSLISNKAFTYPKNHIIDRLMPKIENAIRYIKNFGITPDKIDLNKVGKAIEILHDPTPAYSKADMKNFLKFFVEAYKHYENSKGDQIDYTDMLLVFLEKFQGKKFQHVLVDEMQDMNGIEAQIVEKVFENLFLVGDVKQAIFGFQGGSIKNFERFAKSCKPMLLSTNRRSTQEILDYSKKFFLDGTGQKSKFEPELKNFKSSVGTGPKPEVFSTKAPMKKIQKVIDENAGKEIGVITRTNFQIIEISKYLDMKNIDYASTASQSITQEATQQIMIFIKGLITNNLNDKVSSSLTPFSPFTLQEAFEFSNGIQRDGTMKKTKNSAKLDSWKIDLTKESLDHLFLETIYPRCVSKGSEWFSTAVSVKEQIDEYLTFELPTLEGLLDFLAITEESYGDRSKKAKVTLTSVHKAKGRAFDVVIYVPTKVEGRTGFIDTIVESIFLSKKINLGEELLENTLRIDFVALTRAKEKLFIVTDEESSGLYHIQKFSEFDSDSEEDETTTSALDNRLSEAYSLFVSGRYSDSKNLLKSKEMWLREFIVSYFQNVERLSYSAITPDPYLFLSKQIIKKPFGSWALEYGKSVHDALQKIVQGRAKVEDYTDEEQKAIKNGLSHLEELKNQNPGLTLVPEWTEKYKKVPIKSLTTYKQKDNFMFGGFLDAVFTHDNGVVIVDWKTNRSDNDKAKHKRQLAVYKKMYSILENVPENKIQTCVIYVALRNGINNGQMNSKIEYDSSSRAFGTFEKHLQKVLEWKKNPDVFIKELLEQSTEDTLHEVIKQKLNLK